MEPTDNNNKKNSNNNVPKPPAGSWSAAALGPQTPTPANPDVDDFGLPVKRLPAPQRDAAAQQRPNLALSNTTDDKDAVNATDEKRDTADDADSDSDEVAFEDAQTALPRDPAAPDPSQSDSTPPPAFDAKPVTSVAHDKTPNLPGEDTASTETSDIRQDSARRPSDCGSMAKTPPLSGTRSPGPPEPVAGGANAWHNQDTSITAASSANAVGVSEFSHQQLSMQREAEDQHSDGEWQTMPAYARFDMYDDDNRLIAREHNEEDEKHIYGGLGGAGKGYTRVLVDDDAQSATSMDENTQYLFREANGRSMMGEDEARDALAQMQATKDLLTEGQRIAYVGVARLEVARLVEEAEDLEATRKTRKDVSTAAEAIKMWGQKMMIRLYTHMDISEAEQLMIEQLAEHGVIPGDLTPALHANSRVWNPMAKEKDAANGADKEAQSPRPSAAGEKAAEAAPLYESAESSEVPQAQTPSQLPTTEKIDIDLRWTVLCDLFLILVADSVYDARSRLLLERVGASLDITWIDICKFEKRVTDALEMQQAAEKENWNEEEHMEARRKMAQKRRYVMMGLATVGGGLVIGLSAGLLAPVIGAGLAAGFTTIGVTGTSSFLAGAGGAAIITSSAAASGSIIGVRAADRRTGAVKTFEYRPLHNNKRVNLILTVSGWLTGKVDDVRLPFSTVDPIMGDIYSVLWEPEMLRSMGDTINILATEALTQGLQQILGSTILVSLMAALQLPIVLTKLSYLIDNPWAVSLDRATSAGLILADSLVEHSLGTRPITLVGYSLGARVIFSCLRELAKKGAYGLIQNVYLFGSPIVVKKEEYLRARTIVCGRFVNGYNRNDWILGYLFRLTNGGIRRVAGLAAIEDCPWIENMDVSELVAGHMEYRRAMPVLLMKCGWMVESEEFTEIEDPDPEKHQERQRELINEIGEARKELEREGKAKKGSKFGLFSRRKKAERQEWEVYEDTAGKERSGKVEDREGNNHGVLFDIDAIRAELAKEAQHGAAEEQLQVKEIESTLPPMKLDMSPASASGGRPAPAGGQKARRETKSTEAVRVGGSSDARRATSQEGIGLAFGTSSLGDGGADGGETASIDQGPGRPAMRTSQTVPNMTLADPWADADDEDFGKEREISMTFA